MKKISFLNLPDVFVEIGQDSLQAIREDAGVELPLERLPDGRLTTACKDRLIAALKNFLQPKGWQPRARALCAINARGVSLRKLSLPAGAKEEFHRRLLLQIESEFPLSPGELAWGAQSYGAPSSANGAIAKQDLLVAAVKKEVIADYQGILWACGTNPFFTLAALARNRLCQPAPAAYAILDIGNRQSELTVFEKGVPTLSRMVFADGENLDALAQAIKTSLTGTKLFISGHKISEAFALQLAKSLGNGWECEQLAGPNGTKSSAAISGLKKFAESDGLPPLVIRLKQTGAASGLTAPDVKKWLVRAAWLTAILLLLPYVEAFLLKSRLAKKVSAYQAEAVRLTMVDHELDFLQYLKQSQPPYLNALFVFSQSVSPGTHFDALSMNGRGEISLRGSFRDGQQVSDFRSKLIDSGVFTNVTVEEQAPAPNGQQVNVRMTAQWKPGAPWPTPSTNLSADGMGNNKNGSNAGPAPNGFSPAPPAALPPAGKESN